MRICKCKYSAQNPSDLLDSLMTFQSLLSIQKVGLVENQEPEKFGGGFLTLFARMIPTC